ncbi:TPA: hypothetical protein ACH5PA_004923, partial [Escherichia coli]
LRNHNDYSASSILSFALSSASYRADFPQIEVSERINSLGLLPRFPALQVFEIINGLGHRAILHFASQRNFALSGISASYRRSRSGFFH